MPTSNWCLVTAYDSEFSKIAALTVPTMRDYAMQHGIDFAEFADCAIQPAAWSKLFLAREKFDEGYEFVFWIDADAIIRRFDEDIRTQIDATHDLYFAFEEGWDGLLPSTVRLNSGVFVWRNTPAVSNFIEAVIARRDFLNHKWWDQAGMTAVLGLWSHFDDEHHRPDQPTDFFRLVKRLPSRWNSIMGRIADPNTIIRHYLSMDAKGKLLALQIDELLEHGDPGNQITQEAFRRIVSRLWVISPRQKPRKQNKRWGKALKRLRSRFRLFP